MTFRLRGREDRAAEKSKDTHAHIACQRTAAGRFSNPVQEPDRIGDGLALHLVEGVGGKGQVQEDHHVVVGRVGEPECVAIAQRGRVDARWD